MSVSAQDLVYKATDGDFACIKQSSEKKKDQTEQRQTDRQPGNGSKHASINWSMGFFKPEKK